MTVNVGCNGLVVVLLCLCGSGLILSSTPETNPADDKSLPVADRLVVVETGASGEAGGAAAASRIPRTLAQPHPQHQQLPQQQQQQQQAEQHHVRVARRSQKELPDMLMKERSSWRLAGAAPSVDRWQEEAVSSWERINDLRRNQVADDDETEADDDDDDDSVDRLNWREAQLARLHGLGPAEIEALSSWQHRFKVHPLPKRLNQPRAAVGPSKAAQAYRPWMQLEQSHSINAIVNNQVNRSNAVNGDSQPLWSKRSFNNNSNNNGRANKEGKVIKDKANNRGANGNDPSSKGKGKSSRKQQQQQQQQAAAAATAAAAAAVSSMDQQQGSSSGKDRPTLSQLPTAVDGVSRMNRNLAAQFLLRSPRENRQYDVPIIECPPAEDGMERFACPSPDLMSRYRCIDDHVLCDGFIDCPGGEDEDGQSCMFYKTMKAHLDLVADALLRWVRGR